MATETVSVIIPTYNRAYCVARAIDSALNQTHRDVEVIVVDDGSTDDTPQLMARTYGSEPRVHYVTQPNGGVAAARNHGIRIATGSYVALLDSDDVWYPWKLELQLACLRAAPDAGMVWTDMEGINPAGEVEFARFITVRYSAYRWFTKDQLFPTSIPLDQVAPALASAVGQNKLYVGDIYSAMIMGSLVHTSTVLMRRDRLDRVGFFDEALQPLGEDYPFHLKTCFEGPVAFADVPSIRYQIGLPDRLTAHRFSLANNSLKTLLNALRNHRGKITLPSWMIRAKLAAAHQWVGSELLASGQRGQAVSHLIKSAWYGPTKPRTIGLLGLAFVPSGFASGLRAAFRQLRVESKAAAPGWFVASLGIGGALTVLVLAVGC
jgi:glycosyltransferase involved in cell wall biosynthesis